MRTIATVVALSFLVLYASAATSSSSATTSSSSSKSSSSSAVSNSSSGTTNSSSSGASTYGSCTKGSDAPCIAINSEYCCMYTWYQFSGQDKVETYTCAYNPDNLGTFSTIANAAKSLASDVTASSGYDSGNYCANSLFIRVSSVLVSLGFVSLLF
jgi:hypothetical protein